MGGGERARVVALADRGAPAGEAIAVVAGAALLGLELEGLVGGVIERL